MRRTDFILDIIRKSYIIVNIRKGKVTVHALCTSSDDLLSMYQVYLSLSILSEICSGSNSINTGNKFIDFVFCIFSHDPISVYQVSLNDLQYF